MECGIGREAPFPVTTVVVQRQSYPRVPPELLLRVHAGKFRMTGFSLISLLEAISPRSGMQIPAFFSHSGISGDFSDELVRNFLNGVGRRPQVPRDNIKESGLHSKKFDRETMKAKQRRDVSSLSTTLGDQGNLPTDSASCIFEQVDPSYISAVEIVRKDRATNKSTNSLNNDGKYEETFFPGSHDDNNGYTISDSEVLWGYNTGAVVYVNLRAFEADLSIRRRYKTLLLKRQCSYIDFLSQNKQYLTLDDGQSTSSSGTDEGSSSLTSYNETEDNNPLYKLTECAPKGLSLLGYHPVGAVFSLVYASHTDLAVSGGTDGTLLVWDLHQKYRGEWQEKHNHDKDARNMRTTQQFCTYVRNRRLIQRIDHAHGSGICALSTHCEFLISGGVDGSVKVWVASVPEARSSQRKVPQYVEWQVFHCGGWVRHIWCAPDRCVQGDDVLIVSEGGQVTCFKGRALSGQTTSSKSPQRREFLLEALQNPCKVSIPLDRWNKNCGDKESAGNMHGLSCDKNFLGKHLKRGIDKRALYVTRIIENCNSSREREDFSGDRLRMCEKNTAITTRIIPLVERNLFITLGYGSMVRFLDMNRLSVTAVVKHPGLIPVKNDSTQDNATWALSKSHKREKKISQPKWKKPFPTCPGGMNALRFIDVLYVTSHDYLLLLDCRNTVFVWDNFNNTMLTSWKVPETSDDGRNNTASRLLPCGTLHYESGTRGGQGGVQYQKKHQLNSFTTSYDSKLQGLKMPSDIKHRSLMVENIPFFVVCNMSLELCEVVISADAKLEFRAHQDPVVGIFLYDASSVSLKEVNMLDGSNDGEIAAFEKYGLLVDGKVNGTSKRSIKTDDGTSTSPINEAVCNDGDKDDDRSIQGQGDENSDEAEGAQLANMSLTSECFQQLIEEVNSGQRASFVSSSMDGTICVWGPKFELLRSYHPRNLSKEDASSCTVISLKLPPSDDVVSSFNAPPLAVVEKKNGAFLETQKSGCHDITSFHFSTRFKLAITGHDDGSVRFWPCSHQLTTCVWYKKLHQNAISGLTEACISKSDEQQRMLARLGMKDDPVGKKNTNELLATISFDGYLGVWVYTDHVRVLPYARTRVSHNELLCITFQSVNELFIIGDSGGTISSWHVQTLEPCCRVPSRPPPSWRPAAQNVSLIKLSFSRCSESKSSASNSRSTIQVGHTEAVTALVVDGNFVFSGGEDGRVFLWNLKLGTLLQEYYLLHDNEDVAAAVAVAESWQSIPTAREQTVGSNKKHLFDSSTGRRGGKNLTQHRHENVTFIALLPKNRGDFLVSTRECWIYRFKQGSSYPIATYLHISSVRCMCILHQSVGIIGAGLEDGRKEMDSFLQEKVDAFELVVGCEDGKFSVVHESFFLVIPS